MQKRIFLNFVMLILICVVFLAISFGLLFFRSAQTHEMTSIRDKTHLIAELLNQGTFENNESLDSGETRMTIISQDGWVLSDSHDETDLTVNRNDRMEFI